MRLPAKILIGSVFLETDLEVCSLNENKIGCAFGKMPASHYRVLHEFIKPRMLGKSLREIRSKEACFKWFQGDDETQILFWSKPEGGLEKAEFYFMEYVIFFDGINNSLRTGFMQNKFQGSANQRAVGTVTHLFHETPSFRALRLGHGILEYASLPDDVFIGIAGIMFREEKCSFNRVLLGEKDRAVTFEFIDQSQTVVLRVLSLCSTAISAVLPDNSEKRKISQGTVLDGTLRLADQSMTAAFKVVFQHDFLIGGGLRLQQESDKESLSAFLVPRLLGKSLELIDSPAETRPFAPRGSSVSLYVGIHNTHLLSLLMPPDKLLYSRLVFGDRIVVWDKECLSCYSCPQGFIFPADWDIPLNERDALPVDEPFLNIVREILQNAKLAEEVLNAWQKILPGN